MMCASEWPYQEVLNQEGVRFNLEQSLMSSCHAYLPGPFGCLVVDNDPV